MTDFVLLQKTSTRIQKRYTILFVLRLNPAHTARRHNHQLVAKICLCMIRQQRKQQLGDICRGSWVGFHSNDPVMFRQREDHPITKMTINCDERSFLLDCPLQNQCVISPCLASFLRANRIMPCVAQKPSQFDPQHLIQIKAHGGLRNIQGGDFRVQNGMPGVLQGSLNVIPRQFRVAPQQCIPRFIVGQLFQNCGHRNPCALNDRLAATNTRIDFNALVHARTIPAVLGDRKRSIFSTFGS